MNLQKWDSTVLEQVLRSASADPLRMLLLRDMCLIGDQEGGAPLLTLATRFRNFFRKRAQEGKAELDPGAIAMLEVAGSLGEQTIGWWSATIAERVLSPGLGASGAPDWGVGNEWFSRHGEDVVWQRDLWSGWSAGFRKAVRNAAEIWLIEYFETNVEGGW